MSSFKAEGAERIDNDFCFGAVIETFSRLEHEEIFRWLAFVLMPDHIHMIIRLDRGIEIGYAMKRFKGATARRINKARGRSGSIWYKGFHERMIRPDEPLSNFINYIKMNPVKKKLVSDPSKWQYMKIREEILKEYQ